MRPQPQDYPHAYEPYISLTDGDDIKSILSASLNPMESFLKAIPIEKGDCTYEEGKWTVKEVLQHAIDSERVFAYRALCHARGEKKSLPGFDQNEYATLMDVSNSNLTDLADELILIRKSTIALFSNLDKKNLEQIGKIGNYSIKALSWGYILVGHWLHHQNILQDRYGL